jgi:hypothetical protein
LRKSLPESTDKSSALDAIGGHARSFRGVGRETTRSRMHAETCAKRQIEMKDQELRSFVVKHSLVQIYCVIVIALILIAAKLLEPVRVHLSGDIDTASMDFAGAAIAASTRSIGRAIAHSRR